MERVVRCDVLQRALLDGAEIGPKGCFVPRLARALYRCCRRRPVAMSFRYTVRHRVAAIFAYSRVTPACAMRCSGPLGFKNRQMPMRLEHESD
jgi:hypothetical protein